MSRLLLCFSFCIVSPLVMATASSLSVAEELAAKIEPFPEPLDAPWVDPFAGRTSMSKADAFALIRTRLHNAPKVGEPAPLFELTTADGAQTIKLEDYRGQKPLVLIFGSMT